MKKLATSPESINSTKLVHHNSTDDDNIIRKWKQKKQKRNKSNGPQEWKAKLFQSKLLKLDSNARVGKQQWQLRMPWVLLHNDSREGGVKNKKEQVHCRISVTDANS